MSDKKPCGEEKLLRGKQTISSLIEDFRKYRTGARVGGNQELIDVFDQAIQRLNLASVEIEQARREYSLEKQELRK